jgi:hypothetical protein
MECGSTNFAGHRVRYAIDRPPVKPFLSRIFLREGHLKYSVWHCSNRPGSCETCVVSFEDRRSNPLRFHAALCVLDYDSHTVPAIIVGKITHNPDARMSHMHDRGDSSRRANPQHGNLRGVWNGISIERDDPEGMTRQSQAANFRGAPVQDMNQDSLSLLHAGRFPWPSVRPLIVKDL